MKLDWQGLFEFGNALSTVEIIVMGLGGVELLYLIFGKDPPIKELGTIGVICLYSSLSVWISRHEDNIFVWLLFFTVCMLSLMRAIDAFGMKVTLTDVDDMDTWKRQLEIKRATQLIDDALSDGYQVIEEDGKLIIKPPEDESKDNQKK
jgi:hypothetical protein